MLDRCLRPRLVSQYVLDSWMLENAEEYAESVGKSKILEHPCNCSPYTPQPDAAGHLRVSWLHAQAQTPPRVGRNSQPRQSVSFPTCDFALLSGRSGKDCTEVTPIDDSIGLRYCFVVNCNSRRRILGGPSQAVRLAIWKLPATTQICEIVRKLPERVTTSS